jgi:Major Facilitator Superfamily
LVDRLGFKRASVLADLACGVIVAAIPLLYQAGVLTFWKLLVLVFLLSSINTPGDAARFALIPAVARRAMMPTAKGECCGSGDRTLRPGCRPTPGWFLDHFVGRRQRAAIGRWYVRRLGGSRGARSAVRREGYHGTEAESRSSYISELIDGLRFVRRNALILSMFLVVAVTNFLDVPLITVVLPVYTSDYYGSAASFGVVVAALAGAFVGTLLFGVIGHRLPRRLTFISSFVIAPLVLFLALIATPPLGVVVASAFVGGLISGPINPFYETVIQEQTPPRMLGRVIGALQSLAMVGIPFGTALTGVAAEQAGSSRPSPLWVSSISQ